MYIAYSALRPTTQQTPNPKTETTINEQLLRYYAYQSACAKYHNEIAAIQKYIPNWQPKFY